MILSRALALAILFLGACTDLAPIARDVCGNGLLEPGEDCDSSDPSCVSCAVTCTVDSECPTADYRCGVDGFCHAPGGALGRIHEAGTFQADELQITDLDHDGIGDAFGLSGSSVLVRHGDPAGQLSDVVSIVTPLQSGPAAFGDVDNDGALDLALATPDGLVSYTSRYGSLAPVAVASSLVSQMSGEPVDVRKLFFIAPNVLAGVIADPATGALALLTIDGAAPQAQQTTLEAPCAVRLGAVQASAFDPADLDVYPIRGDNAGRYDAIISFPVVSMTKGRSHCVILVHRDAPTTPFPAIQFIDITPAALGAPMQRTLIVDLDDDAIDPCPGLVTSEGGLAAMKYFEGTEVSGKCQLAATAVNLPALPARPGARLVARVPVAPRVFLIAGDALVTTDGVYAYAPLLPPFSGFGAVYRTPRVIARAVHGDFEGDGDTDVAVAFDGAPNIDVLLRYASESGFNQIRIDTTSTITSLTAGDFDANEIDDLVYTEDFDDHHRMMVAFGTTDRFRDPALVGVFADLVDVSKVALPDSVDTLGLADDLVVLQPPTSADAFVRVSLLHGSPQRTLISYFDPRFGQEKDSRVFRATAIGHFAPSDGDPYRDLLALAPYRDDSEVADSSVLAWRMPGSADGIDGTPHPGITVGGLAGCAGPNADRFCLEIARYAAFPAGEDRDVMIAIDRSRRAITLDPWQEPWTAIELEALSARIPELTLSRSLHAADLDGDGAPELVAAFAPGANSIAPGGNSTTPGAIVVCTMSGGVAQQCDDLVPEIIAAAASQMLTVNQCFDATPVRLSYRDPTVPADPRSDVVVACRGDGTLLFRVTQTADGRAIERVGDRVSLAGTVAALRAGDVTGDGVDDIVLLEGAALRSLHVIPQCTSRDLACLAGDR